MADPAVAHVWQLEVPVTRIVKWGMRVAENPMEPTPHVSYIIIQVDGQDHEVQIDHGQLVGLQNFYQKQMNKGDT